MKATVENIKKILEKAEVLGDINELNNDIKLQEQGIDSLDMMNVYLLIEEEFGVKIPDEDIDKVQTINEIVEYVNKKLGV